MQKGGRRFLVSQTIFKGEWEAHPMWVAQVEDVLVVFLASRASLMRVSLTDIIMHIYVYMNYEIYGPFNVDCSLTHSSVHAGSMILFKLVTVVFSYKVASAVIRLSNTSL